MRIEVYLDYLDTYPKELLIMIIKRQKEEYDATFSAVKSKDADRKMFASQIKKHFGGQQQLAELLGVTQATTSRWVTGRTPLPADKKARIIVLSNGEFKFNAGEVK